MRLRSSRVVWASSAVSVGVLVVAAGWLGARVWAPRCVHGVSRDRSPGGGVADGCAAPFCGLSFVRATSELQFLRRPVDSQPAVCAPGPWSGLVTASEHAAVWSVYTWVQWPIQKIVLELGANGSGVCAVPPVGVQGQGAKSPLPRSWSINAFCVMVQTFSRIPKCKN